MATKSRISKGLQAHQRIFIAAALAFALDQISKWFVVRRLRVDIAGQIDVLPPLLQFRYGENRGINFGLFDSYSEVMPWILIGVSVLISLAVWIWVARRHPQARLMHIAAGLLVGGALANALDRGLYGYVLDFLNMSCCGINNPYVFNIADIFIFAGAIGLALFEPRAPRAGSGGSGGSGRSGRGKTRKKGA
ncbi:MAG: signal peptidase II [Pseudomonadota bacterium]